MVAQGGMNVMGVDISGVVITAIITSAVSSLVASTITWGIKQKKEHDDLDATLLVLLRSSLLSIYTSYIVPGEPIPLFVKEVAASCYDDYHKRGGNSTGTYIYEEIQNAPTQENSKNTEE